MRRTRAIVPVAAALAAVASTASAGLADTRTPAAAQLSVLSAPRAAGDALPGYVPRFAGERIAADSTRFLGTAEGASHWAAVNASGKPCLVSVIPGKDWTAATTCASARTLATKGIGLQVGGRSTASEAYLVPDGYTVAGARKVAPNLVTLKPTAARPDTLQARPTSTRPGALRIHTLTRASTPAAPRGAHKLDTVQNYWNGDVNNRRLVGSGNWTAMTGGTAQQGISPSPVGSQVEISTWIADLQVHWSAAPGQVVMNHEGVDGAHSACLFNAFGYDDSLVGPLTCDLYSAGSPQIPPGGDPE